jgi:hypothetical protein
MKAMIDNITDLECKSIVIGMPHRGAKYEGPDMCWCLFPLVHWLLVCLTMMPAIGCVLQEVSTGMKGVQCTRLCTMDCCNIVLPCVSAGRLNVLANVVRKPMAQIFAEFSGKKLKGPEG